MNMGMDMSKVKGTIINFIVPLICFSASLLLIIFIIYPSISGTQKAKDELNAQIQKKLSLEEKVLKLKKLVDFKTMLDENSGLIDKVLVSEANVPQLLDEVFQIATNSGMKISRLSYSFGDTTAAAETKGSGSQPTSQVGNVAVSLAGDVSYDQMIVLLENMENAARAITTEDLRYSKNEEGVLSTSYSIGSSFLFVQSNAVTDEPVELDVTDPNFTTFINKIKALKYYEFQNPNIAVIETKQTTPSVTTP